MTRFAKLFLASAISLAGIAPIAAARPPVVIVRGAIGPRFYGPAYGWYGPAWVGPYDYAPVPRMGSVKIDTKMKDAAVFIDGGFSGTVRQLKTFSLRPGSHDLELRAPDGRTFYQERIEVIPGKTLKIRPGY